MAASDGNGWSVCERGHRHWGRFGAAGLLVTDGARVVLQHRSANTHEGNSWALPGGARDSHETAEHAALREAAEEAGIADAALRLFGQFVDDHGGWSYTTVLADAIAPVEFGALNFESTDIRWWDLAEVDALPLHSGFALTWPRVRALVERG